MATSETAATREPGGPDRPSTEWLILQRLDDLRRGQDGLKADVSKSMADLRVDISKDMDDLRTDIKALDAKLDAKVDSLRTDLDRKIDSVRNWSLGLLLLAIVGLLTKLLLPGA